VVIAVVVVCAALAATIVLSTGEERVAGRPVAASGPATASTTPTPEPDVPDTGTDSGQAGPVVTGSAGAELPPPTGAKIPELSGLSKGACAEPRITGDGSVVMYQADCVDAPLVLDQVATGECPLENFAGVGRAGETMYCFSWQLDVGDCLDLERWSIVPCGTTASGLPTSTVVDVRVGETDGMSCRHPLQFLQAGQGDARGVACYETTDTGDGAADGDGADDRGADDRGIPVPTTGLRR
jgi:hypothetical protein